MNNNSEASATSGSYCIKPADDAGTVWFVFGPSGGLIGSCSSRDGALRLINLVGGSTIKPQESVAMKACARAVEEVEPEVKLSTKTLMFEWYSPLRERSALSLVKNFFKYIGVQKV